MRRIMVMCVVWLLLTPFVSAEDEQEGPLGWVQSAGGFEEEKLAGHVVMDDGSIIVAGEYVTASSFGEDGIGATGMSGDADIFVAKINESGNWTSIHGFGSNGADGVDSIALHPSGDIILAGHFCLGTGGESCGMTFTDSFTLDKSEDRDYYKQFYQYRRSSQRYDHPWRRIHSQQLLQKHLYLCI